MEKNMVNGIQQASQNIALFLFIYLVVAPMAVFADAPTSCSNQGYNINYLGRIYSSSQNTTKFSYRITRGLLAKAFTKLNFPLSDKPLANPLISVTSSLPYLLSDLIGGDTNLVSFIKPPLPLVDTTVDLSFLGNVDEGDSAVDLQVGTSSPLVHAAIRGPKILNIIPSLPTAVPVTPGTGTPVAHPTPVIPGLPTIIPTLIAALPDCLVGVVQPVIATVGKAVSIPLTVTSGLGAALNVSYSNLPDGASCSAPSGSTVSSGAQISFGWTPTSSDVGIGHVLPIAVKDILNNIKDCKVVVDVVEDNIPQIVLQPLADLITCQGIQTVVTLDASASFDPEGEALSYLWTSNCINADITGATTNRPTIKLYNPGSGTPQSCTANVVVSDGTTSATLNVPLAVSACDVSCPTQQLDSCGVCNGLNLCLDCSGVLNGGKTVDRCGVCGGTNACNDCKGVPNGGSTADICGTCGGNGRSCLSCSTVDNKSVQTLMDGTSASQARLISSALKKTPTAALAKAKKRMLAAANKLYVANWTVGWSLPATHDVCSHYQGCTTSTNSDEKTDYTATAVKLRNLAYQVANLWKQSKLPGSDKSYRKLRKDAKARYATAEKVIKMYPDQTHECD